MNISGYDAWKLAGPNDNEEACEYCGEWENLRVEKGDTLVCANCYATTDGDQPDFDDLPTPAEVAQERVDLAADYKYEQMKDSRMENR